MKYKPSAFNYYFSISAGITGIFNTLSGSIIGLPDNDCAKLRDDSSTLDTDSQNLLASSGFLVPYSLNEYDAVHMKRIQSILNNDVSFDRILTTLDCNARCFYCYERKSKHEYMDLSVAEQTAKFILDHINERRCVIQWFGGEPLMNTKVIDLISSMLREKLNDEKIRSVMITNASLADAEIIRRMKESWNLYLLQITLDGTSEEYGHRKNYISVKDPFGLVIRNIKNILRSGIKVSVRLNYDRNNYLNLCELVKYLKSEGFHKEKNFTIYSYPIFSTGQNITPNVSGKEEWFAIQTALMKNEFLTPKEAFALRTRRTQCYGCSSKSFIVMPNGELFKCTLSVKNPAERVGDIWNGITCCEAINRWCNTSVMIQCNTCCFLPICQGGCRAGVLDYTSDLCFFQKNFADDVLRERIKYCNPSSVKQTSVS